MDSTRGQLWDRLVSLTVEMVVSSALAAKYTDKLTWLILATYDKYEYHLSKMNRSD